MKVLFNFFAMLAISPMASFSLASTIETSISDMPISTGATRTEVRYGPFHVEAQTMYPHTPYITTQKPCIDCYLVAMQTELEYINGTVANFDSGIWLHHLMQFNTNQADPVCAQNSGNLFYGPGNERPIWELNSDAPFGYYVAQDDVWVNGVEIMNDSNDAKDVQVTVTYDWVPASTPVGQTYKNADLIWVNIGATCGDGEVPPQNGVTTFKSDVWESTVTGPILTARAHMHDGGMNATLYINGKVACLSEQSYAPRDGFTDAQGVSHLSGASGCADVGMLQKGDQLYMEAVYDSSKALQHNGKLDNFVAVMFVYVGVGGP
jgi:hypothetical protein